MSSNRKFVQVLAENKKLRSENRKLKGELKILDEEHNFGLRLLCK